MSEEKEEKEPRIRGLQFNYKEWNTGGKIIFYATVLAIVSILLPWIEGDGDTLGYQQGASVFLALYIYPFLALTMDKPFKTPLGHINGLLAVGVPGYFLYYMAEEMAAGLLEAAGIGIILFMIAGIALLIGIHKYERYDRMGLDKKTKVCPGCDADMRYLEELDRYYCPECDELR